MKEQTVHKKAERIRDVLHYVKKFKDATVVIYIDDEIIDSRLFTSHIRDICLIHESGLNVILVPGARKRINEVLSSAGISWSYKDSCRITDDNAMPLIKMAAFDVSNKVMTALAAEKKTAVIGNWVNARGKGVIDGFDFGTIGETDKLQIDSIKTILGNRFIPIFPCIGWSNAGKPYNISSVELSQQIAIHLQADKLFFLIPDLEISRENFRIPNSFGVSEDGTVPAMNLEEVDEFIAQNVTESSVDSANSKYSATESSVEKTDSLKVSRETYVSSTRFPNELKDKKVKVGATVKDSYQENATSSEDKNLRIFNLLLLAKQACSQGVSRVHLLDGSLNGTLPCEIFSDLGSGTMIYKNNYGCIRNMTREDISAVLNLMHPFIERGNLLPRTQQQMQTDFQHYIVYVIDDTIRACAALIPYSDGQMEIAGVAVDEACSHIGIGQKLISFLLEKAKTQGASNVFLLTTQTSDWFESLGFEPAEISTLPQKRKEAWNPQRNSKVFHKLLKK